MAQPQQPLEIFLIRSYFNKNHKARPPVPKSWGGLRALPIQSHQKMMPGASQNLGYYSGGRWYPIRGAGRLMLLRLLERSFDFDEHQGAMHFTLNYRPIQGPNPHQYTFKVYEDYDLRGSTTLVCSKRWGFLSKMALQDKHGVNRSLDYLIPETLHLCTTSFEIRFSGPPTNFSGRLGCGVRYYFLIRDQSFAGHELDNRAVREVAERLQDLLQTKEPIIAGILRELINCDVAGVRDVLLAIAENPWVETQRKERELTSLKKQFLGTASIWHSLLIFDLENMVEKPPNMTSGPLHPSVLAVRDTNNLMRNLHALVESPTTPPELIRAMIPTTNDGLDIRNYFASSWKYFKENPALSWSVKQKAEKLLPILLQKISVSVVDGVRLARPAGPPGNGGHQIGQIPTDPNLVSSKVPSSVKIGVFVRNKASNDNLLKCLISVFTKAQNPRYLCYDTFSLKPVWGGNEVPLEIGYWKKYTVVITHSAISIRETSEGQTSVRDPSDWSTIDLKEFGCLLEVVHCEAQLTDKNGQLHLLYDEQLVIICLETLCTTNKLKVKVISMLPEEVVSQPYAANINSYQVTGSMISQGVFFSVLCSLEHHPLYMHNLGAKHRFMVPVSNFSICFPSSRKTTCELTAESDVRETHNQFKSTYFRPVSSQKRMLLIVGTWFNLEIGQVFKVAMLVKYHISNDKSPSVKVEYLGHVQTRDKGGPELMHLIWEGRDLYLWIIEQDLTLLTIKKRCLHRIPLRWPRAGSKLEFHQFQCWSFDSARRRLLQYSAKGRYGEGYTISVHPLKLLLN